LRASAGAAAWTTSFGEALRTNAAGRRGVRPVLFDTSVYIPYLRGEAYTGLIERAARAQRVRLSAVVLAELYAGTRSAQDKADLDVVTRLHEALGFLVAPSAHDWVRAGQAIRRYRALYGSVEPREHLNDILILLGNAATAAVVVSENARPFARWAALLRRMGSKVAVRAINRADWID
jgi:predicted nucleic acid-binding protein